MKLKHNYSEGFASLDIQGLPDQSLGHSSDTLGIILSWNLKLIGHSVLEGKKEHLSNLIYVISNYSKYCIAGLNIPITDSTGSISIRQIKLGHELILISSQEGIKPLSILLDDAEIVDLTLCLDKLINDDKVQIHWDIKDYKKLSSIKQRPKHTIYFNTLHMISGTFLFLIFSFLYFNVPIPDPSIPLLEEKQSINEI